jgi:hypothetical protein
LPFHIYSAAAPVCPENTFAVLSLSDFFSRWKHAVHWQMRDCWQLTNLLVAHQLFASLRTGWEETRNSGKK